MNECKKHKTKLINIGYHKKSPQYKEWICMECLKEKVLEFKNNKNGKKTKK
jgi:hypothetical protein